MKRQLKRLIRSTGYGVRRLRNPGKLNRRCVYFLHIGKNAGTQIGSLAHQLNELSRKNMIVRQPHHVLLWALPREDPYFFSIRNPISRFRSGFYSRKRKGQPRYNVAWSPHDEIAFAEFEHANELAESLFEPGKVGNAACAAMKSIIHTSMNQCDWFSCQGNFLRLRPPLWIVRQENFEADMNVLISRAFPDIDPSRIDFSTDDVSSHKNDYSGVPALSQKAKENLERWYAQDIAFYDMCDAWLENGGRV
jgi:hypothetical protein